MNNNEHLENLKKTLDQFTIDEIRTNLSCLKETFDGVRWEAEPETENSENHAIHEAWTIKTWDTFDSLQLKELVGDPFLQQYISILGLDMDKNTIGDIYDILTRIEEIK